MKEYILDDFARPGPTAWTGQLARGAGEFPDNRPSALASGALETEQLPGDWRGYETLQFTLLNPWRRIVLAGFDLYDQAALDSPNLEYGDFVAHARSLLLGEGITHVVVRIHPISTQRGDRMLDLSSIRRLTLRIPEALPGEPMISIANLRLSPSSEIDGLAKARPGDAILAIRHLDIRCYTHQPEQYEDPEDVLALAAQLEAEQKALSDAVRVAQIHGKQTHYADAVKVAADVASKARPLLAWHFSPNAKHRNLSEALALVRAEKARLLDFLSFRAHADDEDDSNLSFGLVKPVPDLGRLTLSGNKLLGPDGRPVLVCSM
nr:hypothetical protein [Clostridia bacterium]